jgi:hypothetical protein
VLVDEDGEEIPPLPPGAVLVDSEEPAQAEGDAGGYAVPKLNTGTGAPTGYRGAGSWKPMENGDWSTRGNALLRGAGQGITFGFGDELNANIVGLANMIGIGDDPPVPMAPGRGIEAGMQAPVERTARSAALEDERRMNAESRAQHPGFSIAGEVGGGVLQQFAGGSALKALAGAPGKLQSVAQGAQRFWGGVPTAGKGTGKALLEGAGQGAKQGAIVGMLSGAGGSESGLLDDPKQVLSDAFEGGQSGLVHGGALGGAAEGVRRGGDATWKAMKRGHESLRTLEAAGGGPTWYGGMRVPKEIKQSMDDAPEHMTQAGHMWKPVVNEVGEQLNARKQQVLSLNEAEMGRELAAVDGQKIPLKDLYDEARALERASKIGGGEIDIPVGGVAGKMRGVAGALKKTEEITEFRPPSEREFSPVRHDPDVPNSITPQHELEIDRLADEVAEPWTELAPAARLRMMFKRIKDNARESHKGTDEIEDMMRELDESLPLFEKIMKVDKFTEATPQEMNAFISSLRSASKYAREQKQEGVAQAMEDMYKKALRVRETHWPGVAGAADNASKRLKDTEALFEAAGVRGSAKAAPTEGDEYAAMFNKVRGWKGDGSDPGADRLKAVLDPKTIAKMNQARVADDYRSITQHGNVRMATSGAGSTAYVNPGTFVQRSAASGRNLPHMPEARNALVQASGPIPQMMGVAAEIPGMLGIPQAINWWYDKMNEE